MIVGTPFFVCTSMVAAKFGVPYVTIAPGDFHKPPFRPCALPKRHILQTRSVTRALRIILLESNIIRIHLPSGVLTVLLMTEIRLPMQII